MLQPIFEYDFIGNAVISMFLLSIIAGIVGSYIVVRRMVFVAGGITHASFGGIGIAYYLGISPIGGAMVFAILTALGIECLDNKAKIRHDSAIAMLWSLGMAIGIIFMFLTPGYTPNLLGFMFGDVLMVSTYDIVSMTIVALFVIIGAIIFYRPIMYIAFAPSFSQIMGWRVRFINIILSIVVAISIVLAIKAVGIILVLAMFTVPQAIANLFTRRFGKMMILSVAISIVGSLVGLILAFLFDLPSGAVVATLFIVSLLVIRACLSLANHHK